MARTVPPAASTKTRTTVSKMKNLLVLFTDTLLVFEFLALGYTLHSVMQASMTLLLARIDSGDIVVPA
jgi:hypothetical protein